MAEKITKIEKELIKLLNILSKRDMEVLRLRFLQKTTQEEVGKIYKVTRERVRQLEDRALKKIRSVIYQLLKKK